MLQAGGDLDLAQESPAAQGGGELRMQHLDGDRPVVLQVLGEVHRCHAALPELALDGVALGESYTEGFEHIGHGCAARLARSPPSI